MGFSNDFLRICTAVGDLFLPRMCVACGEPLTLDERHICLQCLSQIPYTHFWDRRDNPMAEKFNAALRASIPDSVPQMFEYAAALFIYNSETPYRRIPQRLKYGGDRSAGKYFARRLGAMLASSELFKDVDLVIPVPLHPLRRLRRGFNQAEVIAADVALVLGAPLCTNVLRRTRYSSSQTHKSVEAKAANVRGAFRAKMPRRALQPHHILLVDDTFTTGSTLASCHEALSCVFPPSVRISVATLAYVGD